MKKIAIIAASLSCLAAAPAVAQDMVVSYADLDVSSAAGIAALNHRLEASAEEVCGVPGFHNVKLIAAREECKSAVVAEARQQLSAAGGLEGEQFAAN